MTPFEVEVQIMPSQGGGIRRVKVKAKNQAEALLKATLALDEAGVTHWSLIRVASLLN
jgi:hypothetical protein